jgi:hypothetical protein
MTSKYKNNVHYNIQQDALCFAPWPQIALDAITLNSIYFDLHNDWINVYS